MADEVDAALFADAIAEVKRLEGMRIQPKEVTKEQLAGMRLFEEKDDAPTVATWDKALYDALGVEEKAKTIPSRASALAVIRQAEPAKPLPIFPKPLEVARPPAPKPMPKLVKAPPPPHKPIEIPSPKPAELPPPPPKPIEVPTAPPPAPPAPEKLSDEEQMRQMKERLMKMLEKRPVQQAEALPAPSPKKTLYEKMQEEMRKTANVPPKSTVPKAAPVHAPGPQPTEEERVQERIAIEQAKKLKEELTEKLGRREEELKKRKKLEQLSKELEKLGEEG